jgi:hypothetical protein
MNQKHDTMPSTAIRALPDEPIGFEIPNGVLVIFVELPKNANDPYVTIRYEFKPTIPQLRASQMN